MTVTDAEFEALEGRVRSLVSRLAEAEEALAAHGIYGGSVGQLYPHPRTQAQLLEFGGSRGRLDEGGIQFKFVDNSSLVFFRVADSFSEDQFIGYQNTSPNFFMWAIDDDAASMLRWRMINRRDSNGTAEIEIRSQSTTAQAVVLSVEDMAGVSSAVLKRDSTGYRFRLTDVSLGLALTAVDPTTILDGDLWYRTDTDKIRARINGVTENLATEAWAWSPTITSQSSDYTAVKNNVVLASNTITITLTAAATVGSGGIIVVKNTGTGVITVDGNGSETIDGALTYTLGINEALMVVCDGSNWRIM